MVHAEAPAFCSCSGSKTDRPTRFAITGAAEGNALSLSRGGTLRVRPPRPSDVFARVVPPPTVADFATGAAEAANLGSRRWHRGIGQVADAKFEPDGRHLWVLHRGSRVWGADSFDASLSGHARGRCLHSRTTRGARGALGCARRRARSRGRSAPGATGCHGPSRSARTAATCGSSTPGRTRWFATIRRPGGRSSRWGRGASPGRGGAVLHANRGGGGGGRLVLGRRRVL